MVVVLVLVLVVVVVDFFFSIALSMTPGIPIKGEIPSSISLYRVHLDFFQRACILYACSRLIRIVLEEGVLVCNSPATLCHPRRSQDPLLSDAFAVGVVIFGQLGASSMSSP